MTASAAPAIPFTLNDIDIAARVFEALIADAGSAAPRPLAPADLLAQARALHPRDAALARAVALGLGPKLALIAAFCQQHSYPNLAALAAHPVAGNPAAPVGDFAGVDWSKAPAQWASASKTWRAAVPARLKPRGERPADVAWYAWFRSHRPACAQVTPEGKQEIINLVMAGLDPETALARVLAAQAEYGVSAAA
jgi:hypothetical protein